MIRISLLALLLFISQLSFAKEIPKRSNIPFSFEYPAILYQQGDFLRCISESKRLIFIDPKTAATYGLRLLILKSHKQLSQHNQVERESIRILQDPLYNQNRQYQKETGILLSHSLLLQNREFEAKSIWEEFVSRQGEPNFPQSDQIKNQINQETARFYSSIIPGAGLIQVGEFKKGITSFVLNTVFLVGAYQLATKKRF